MVVAAPQQPAGVGPQTQNIPHVPPPAQGPRPPVPGAFRGQHPDCQQPHNNWPFFYVQPSQPFLPYQWPMPMPYVPYGGFPRMGYGMVMPPLPPATYMEAPGYIFPHAQLHMVDYRRMTAPQLAPTMAYQSRRFRYQHTAPSGRVMVSSEVQTEPVDMASPQLDCKGTSSQTSCDLGKGTSSGSNLSSPRPSESVSPEEAFGLPLNKNTAEIAGTTCNIAPAISNGEIFFQAEEVRIECSETPTGLKIIHAKETTELASNGELLQCNMGSLQSAEDVVLRCCQPLPFGKNEPRECSDDLNHTDEQYLPTCPDILMMGSHPGDDDLLEELDGTRIEPGNSTEMHTLVIQEDPPLIKGGDLGVNPKNVQVKILRLPFDLQSLEELHQMEASVWSVESLVPYVPSTEWMIQNGLLTPQKQPLTTVMEVPAEVPQEANQIGASTASTPQENMQTERVTELDGQEPITSLESLPPYHPAASWLADFSNVCYSEIPSNIQTTGNLKTWPENEVGKKMEVQENTKVKTVSPKSGSVQLKGHRSKHRSIALGISDQESNFQSLAGMHISSGPKAQICKRCLINHQAGSIADGSNIKTNCVKRYKGSHSIGDEPKVHLCALCLCNPEKRSRCKGSEAASGIQNVDNGTTEVEVSENGSCHLVGPKKVANGQKLCNASQKLPSGSRSGKCTMAHHSKLREQNCSCEGPKSVPHAIPAWDSKRYNDVTQEKNEENLALSATDTWRESEQRFISQKQKEKMWKGSIQGSDSDSTKSAGKTRIRIKQKQCAQTPELHRRDTRC